MSNQQGIAAAAPNKINDPEHWRLRATQARALAEDMSDQEARDAMRKVAEKYERLVVWAEERMARSKSRDLSNSRPVNPSEEVTTKQETKLGHD